MAGEYQVIARKWRPQRFADMVGQEHIVATLKNAIRSQRTAHAYLFVGPRGIGKTTSARIFAKALNCLAPEDGEPCCKCASCLAIAAENSMDVIEIDAASQNSVDNIRDLREEVMHVPVSSRYKIYIIDEVHMLSKQAWNALLKTVEEPPRHVKFIFATTEVHMVLPTIISRCQRFDLQRIPSRLIAGRLMEIAKAENVRISPAAVEAIARAADGGMRDAQSLLDQMIAFFGSGGNAEINEEQVLSLFGLTAAAEIENLVRAVLGNHKGHVIANIHALAARGKNLETLFNDLLVFLRGIELCQLLEQPENVLEAGTETIGVYRQLTGQIRPDVVQRLLETLSSTGRILHEALNKQVYLETVILKAMRLAHSLQVDDLVARLNQIRGGGELEIVAQAPEIAPGPIVMPEPIRYVAPAPLSTPVPLPQEAPQEPETVAAEPATMAAAPAPVPVSIPEPAPLAPETPVVPTPEAQSDLPPEPQPEPENPPAAVLEAMNDAEIEDTPLPEIVAEADREREVYDIDPFIENLAELKKPLPEEDLERVDDEPQPEEEDMASPLPPLPPLPEPVAPVAATSEEKKINPVLTWHEMIERARSDAGFDPIKCDFMAEGLPESFEQGILTVVYDDEYDVEHFNGIATEQERLNRYLVRVVGDPAAAVVLQLRPGIKQYDDGEPQKPRRLISELREVAENNPFVQEILDLFGGEIVDIHG